MKKNKEKQFSAGGGMYRNINISVKLLDVVIIGGLTLMAFIIMASMVA